MYNIYKYVFLNYIVCTFTIGGKIDQKSQFYKFFENWLADR